MSAGADLLAYLTALFFCYSAYAAFFKCLILLAVFYISCRDLTSNELITLRFVWSWVKLGGLPGD